MTSPQSHLSLEEAIELTTDTVRELLTGGKQTLAAGLKPRVQKAALERGRTFSETELGFATFRLFLEEASRRGHLRVVSHGPLQEVLLPGEDPRFRPPSSSGANVQLTREAFRAFANWDPVESWYLGESGSFGSGPVPPGGIRVPAFGLDEQLEAMTRFADSAGVPAAARSALEVRDARQFLNSLGDRRRDWFAFFIPQLIDRVQSWVRDNGLNERDFLEPRAMRPRVGPSVVDVVQGQEFERMLRERLVRALERMTLTELLNLQVPARCLVP